MKRSLALLLLLAICIYGQAETISINFKDINGEKSSFEAVVKAPKSEGKKKALVILHHSGGWAAGTTRLYADFFESNGFVTLEPIMFAKRSIPYENAIPEVFASLNYLATRDDVDKNQISVMGLSYGGLLTTIVATQWVNDRFNLEGNKFKKFAPLYPLCWVGERFITRDASRKNRGLKEFFPEEFMDKWVGAPMLILSGAKDSYDDQDPKACQQLIDLMPDDTQKSMSKNIVFENATHAWDQSYSNFYTVSGCKGRGCSNTNLPDSAVTEQGKKELIKFFTSE